MALWQPGMRITGDRLQHPTPETVSSGIVTIDSAWTLVEEAAAKVGGMIQILVRVQRATANITAGTDGNMTDTTIFTVNSGWRPNPVYGTERLPFVISDGFGHGSALIVADTGVCQASTWTPSQSITTDRFLRVLLTYPA